MNEPNPEQRSIKSRRNWSIRRAGASRIGLLFHLACAHLVCVSALSCSSHAPTGQQDVPDQPSKPKPTKGDPTPAEAATEFGTAELMLRTVDGVSMDQFSFQVKTSTGASVHDGAFSVPGNASQTKLAMELPVATDYEILITGEATLEGSTYPCQGEAQFDVVKDELVHVDLDIECIVPSHLLPETGGVEITATIVTVAPQVSECGIDGLIVGPLTVAPGGFISAQGSAVPSTSAFAWTATEGLYGTFDNPTAGQDVETHFRCFGGSGDIVLTVSSELCTDQFSVPVSCGPAGVCGDGIVQTFRGEVCDDGNTSDGDLCSSACVPTECGDGVVNPGEECDDANTEDNDGCSRACVLEECGDGDTQESEECDDGNSNDNDACTNVCTLPPVCGDGLEQDGEECDDGNTIDDDTCTNACELNLCGDGVVQPEHGEQCDDANTADADGCSAACRTELCGDNVLQVARGELCDDGNTLSGDGCNAGCFTEYCGDGVVQPTLGERCDSSSGCSAECQYLAVCGDGEVNPGESCDDGDTVEGDGCSATCITESCGDGVLQVPLGEDCDDGNRDDNDGCSSACVRELCGDATLHAGEDCDDGNSVNGDGCSSECVVERCGDGLVQLSEQCDDGNLSSGDGCSNDCRDEGSNAGDMSDGGTFDGGLVFDGATPDAN
jgi:cysteine-rich repeat protein